MQPARLALRQTRNGSLEPIPGRRWSESQSKGRNSLTPCGREKRCPAKARGSLPPSHPTRQACKMSPGSAPQLKPRRQVSRQISLNFQKDVIVLFLQRRTGYVLRVRSRLREVAIVFGFRRVCCKLASPCWRRIRQLMFLSREPAPQCCCRDDFPVMTKDIFGMMSAFHAGWRSTHNVRDCAFIVRATRRKSQKYLSLHVLADEMFDARIRVENYSDKDA
jgi:hypothetical protein